jgi:hypothetical protein
MAFQARSSLAHGVASAKITSDENHFGFLSKKLERPRNGKSFTDY